MSCPAVALWLKLLFCYYVVFARVSVTVDRGDEFLDAGCVLDVNLSVCVNVSEKLSLI